MLLHLPGKADLVEEGDETGQTAEGRDRLGRFVQNQLGFAEERGNFVRVVLWQVGSGCLIINPYAITLSASDPFSISEFGFKPPGFGKLVGRPAGAHRDRDVWKRHEFASWAYGRANCPRRFWLLNEFLAAHHQVLVAKGLPADLG